MRSGSNSWRFLAGQSSIEALVAIAVLLSALAILISSSQRLISDFSSSVESSAERHSLSLSAMALDSQGYCVPGVPFELKGSPVVSSGGLSIQSPVRSSVIEPIFHKVSSNSEGRINVQTQNAEPI